MKKRVLIVVGNPTPGAEAGVLEFCGVKPVGITSFGGVRRSTPEKREGWLAKARALGKAA